VRPSNSLTSTLKTAVSAFILIASICLPAESQNAQHGKELFQKLKCVECHSVAGAGGCLGPELDGVMSRRDKAYVRLRLNKDDESAFIKLIGHPELMPHPRFSKADVSDLVSYLNTLSARNPAPDIHHDVKLDNKAHAAAPVKSSAAIIAEGKTLFYNTGCMSCHTVGGLGGILGPSLDGVSQRRNSKEIEAFIAAPRSSGTTKMPKFNLTDDERHKIAAFLLSLPAAKRSYQPG
jgi:nitric oxide reductase subunit C